MSPGIALRIAGNPSDFDFLYFPGENVVIRARPFCPTTNSTSNHVVTTTRALRKTTKHYSRNVRGLLFLSRRSNSSARTLKVRGFFAANTFPKINRFGSAEKTCTCKKNRTTRYAVVAPKYVNRLAKQNPPDRY